MASYDGMMTITETAELDYLGAEAEIEMAARIQRSLRQTNLPAVRGFRVAAFSRSALPIGGDFFEVSREGKDRLWLAIADVMGKGVPAALFATNLGPLLRSLQEQCRTPAELLANLNRVLFRDLSRAELFITAQVALADLKRRELLVAGAGHCPVLVAQPCEDTLEVPAESPPLGIVPGGRFADQQVPLRPGARVLLYTDGLVEAQNHSGHQFGQTAWEDFLQQAAEQRLSAEMIKDLIAPELDRFGGGTPPRDDQTFVVLADENPVPS